MKTIKLLFYFLTIGLTAYSQINNFNYNNSKIFKIKVDGLENVEKARYIDKQLLKSDNVIFSSTVANDFFTMVIVKGNFSYEKLEKLITEINYNCKLINSSDFNNSLFEQIYSTVSFSKEVNTKYGILKKYYTNDKTKDDLNFSKYLEIIESKN